MPVDGRINTGLLDTISQTYESLDYDTNFNSVLLDEMRSRGYKFIIRKVSTYINCFYQWEDVSKKKYF